MSGCIQITDAPQDDTHRFAGTWHNTTGFPAVIVFSSNGTCIYGGESGTWELKENKLLIHLPNLAVTHSFSYWFSDNDTTVMLAKTFGYSIRYTRQSEN
jgi:hypothetical protein